MNLNEHRGTRLLLCCFFLFVFTSDKAQDSVKAALKSEAAGYFLKNDYAHALPLYRELVNIYPSDPFYQYHTALCLLNLNQDLEEAMDLMRMASADADYPLATFYLARACHLRYAFEDAIKHYSRFLVLGKRTDIRKLEVQRLIEMAKNGIDLTRKAKSCTVKNAVISPAYQIENAYFISTNGKVIRKPVEFNSQVDQKMNFSSLMYLPAYTEINEFIYVSGYDVTGKRGTEIFRIRNINHQTWSMPEALGEIINTSFDEDFPFFDTPASALYYSSKGHSSMGGYDIFRSVYDWNTKTWSKPENMGFPINSPYDDFMLVSSDLGQTAQFASNRSTGPGMVMLYHIALTENETEDKLLTVDDLRDLSALAVSSATSGKPDTLAAHEEDIPSGREVGSEGTAAAPFNKNEYNLIIADALSIQVKADSLSRMAREYRFMAKEIPDKAAKEQLISDILELEREAKKNQREADEKFTAARKMKNLADTLPEGDTNLVLHKEINGIKVYQYKIRDTMPVIPPEYQTNTNAEPAYDKSKETQGFTEFNILENTPYSEGNPIPPLPAGIGGLVYRIQLGVFSKPKEINSFGGLYPLYVEWLAEKNMYKYYAGTFSSTAAVTTALEKVRNTGFPDAFVVAFYDARPISTEKAREIEFEKLKL